MSKNKIKDKDYLFLSSMLRAREAKMPDKEIFVRMIDASGFAEAAKLLTDSGYPDMSDCSSVEIEKMLASYRNEIFDELEEIVPESELVHIFRLKYDYHNVKVLIKAQGADVDGEDILSEAGRGTPKFLTDAFNDDDYRDLPTDISAALTEGKSILVRTGNPQLSDFIVDKIYFSEMLELAQRVSTPFLSDYVKLLIDCTNLRMIVRTLRMGKNADFLKGVFIPGGTVAMPQLITVDAVVEAYSSTPLINATQEVSMAISGKTVTAFELSCDNDLIQWLKQAKFVSFGPEAVAAYLAAVEIEITNVRIVLMGKKSGIASDKIKERLRESYA